MSAIADILNLFLPRDSLKLSALNNTKHENTHALLFMDKYIFSI